MRLTLTALLVAPAVLAACAGNPDKRTLAELRSVEPDVTDIRVEDGLDQAMIGYKKFLAEAPKSALTPEALRRLADLKIEKEYGILGDGDIVELDTPERGSPTRDSTGRTKDRQPVAAIAHGSGSQSSSNMDSDPPAASADAIGTSHEDIDLELPGGQQVEPSDGPLEAIEIYDQILATYPNYEHNDRVLYQKARAFDELGRSDEAVAVIERLVAEYPHSRFIDEVQFRRAEYFFTRRKYLDAEYAYAAVTEMGAQSQYYELALYKLGWTLYKQELHEEALDKYVTLLDYKVSIGYDFDQSFDESDERRISDTYRAISLGFSNLGGHEAVIAYFGANGERSYEDRLYSHLGEFYLEKLRYNDAAASYKAFVGLHPLHRSSPQFSMRVVEIYEAGGFPKLVLGSKKEFAASYGLRSEYWLHFDVDESSEVLGYLKSNLKDLANHYHALYQEETLADEQAENFAEASRWYREYLTSFSQDPDTPAIHYQLADLLLEHRKFGAAAREYGRIAYDYSPHEQAAEAGYAAIFAHRENYKLSAGEEKLVVQREAVTSTLKFVDTFPDDEHAAVVLGAAVDDLYEMKELELAITTGQRLLDGYPEAEPSVRRSAWAVVAHSFFDTANYERAEYAYTQVLEMTTADDDSHQAVVDSLAAAIYKQGESANLAEDHRLAADHFLRVARVAPTSEIRPAAEYDAGAALIRLENWGEAAAVLESFRESYPENELRREATKQLALVYQKQEDLSRAASEYERVADEAATPELRREALLLAGELYEDSGVRDRALTVYLRYLEEFPKPLEDSVEIRFKIAKLHEATEDEANYHAELRRIVKIDEAANGERTARIRYLAAQSALILSEEYYHRFDEVELVQPFEKNLKKKQVRMDAALEAFETLVDYEVAEVTAGATYYMAEVYFHFSQALMDSERPEDLDPAQMQDYEMALEETAFPFEEKAIVVHEKNLELMSTGIYNAWVERSIGKLANLMPGRYAKFELSSGLIASIDRYAYRTPSPSGSVELETESDEAADPAEPDPQPDAGPEAESVYEEHQQEAAAAG
jgi:tetratricopeptide (TPR) repeat protein